jgi:VanZ family protein
LHRRREACFFRAVPRARNFVKYWLLPLLWMLVIFSASADTASAHRSSRIIEPILRWLFPEMPAAQIEAIVLIVRKCAHFVEYGVLAVLLWRALWKPARRDPRPWSWRPAGLAILIVAAYAASDEIHQTFVPSRQGSVRDVVLDTSGALAGMLATAALYRRRARRRAGAPPQT